MCIRDSNALTMVHCENGWAIDVLVERALAAGQTDPIYHAHTRPEILEAEATHRSVRLAELANASVFIVHVTCGLAADEIARGKARGVQVSGETCLQYLTNTIHDLERPDFEGARYVCSLLNGQWSVETLSSVPFCIASHRSSQLRSSRSGGEQT